MKLEDAAKLIQEFEGRSLTTRIADLEYNFEGKDKSSVKDLLDNNNLNSDLIKASFEFKNIASQINVIIHAIGILLTLPSILDDNEYIEYLSLGAGNAGKKFDLETNKRIAEFKFIIWKGGAESIRQNSIFKDFFGLAEESTDKERYLYVLGIEKPLKFLNGRRALSSIMSKNKSLSDAFDKKYGSKFKIVQDYYNSKKEIVHIRDISKILL